MADAAIYTLKTRGYYLYAWRGSYRLFRACWAVYRGWLNGAIDAPQSDADVIGWLNTIAAEKVNNARSSFYIYG